MTAAGEPASATSSDMGASGTTGRPGAATAALSGDATPEASLGHVLDAAAVVRARERAADRAGDEPEPNALVVLDLALHRDVDPRVADVEGVLLYDLATLKAHAPAVARGIVRQARDIVDSAVEKFEDTRLGREADVAVVALFDEAEERVRAEVDEAVTRLSAEHALAGRAAPSSDEVEEIARRARRRIHAELHPRIVAVRTEARARAKAQEAAVIESAESITRAAGADATHPAN